jgi:hypothetical protein
MRTSLRASSFAWFNAMVIVGAVEFGVEFAAGVAVVAGVDAAELALALQRNLGCSEKFEKKKKKKFKKISIRIELFF